MNVKTVRNTAKTLAWAAILATCSGFLVATDKVLNIGFLSEQTGGASYVGQSTQPAFDDYIAKVNKSGGVNGYKLKIIAYDTRNETPDCLADAKRMADQDNCIAIIGPTFSGCGIPLARIADGSKVPIVSNTSTNYNVTITEDGHLHPYMFRICFIDRYQAFVLADFAYHKLGARKVAFLTAVSSPYPVGTHKYFKKHFEELGGKIVDDEGYNENDTEFRAQLSAIMDHNPDLIMAAGTSYRDAGLYALQARDLGIKIPILGANAWFADELLTLAGPALEGCYLSTMASTDEPQFAKFNAEFFKAHGVRATIYTYTGLDALMAIEYAIRQASAKGAVPTRLAVRDALENMKDVQLFTSKVTMEPDTHNPHNKPVIMVKIHDSKWVLSESYTPK